jgi:Ca-activated chloride channel family protein
MRFAYPASLWLLLLLPGLFLLLRQEKRRQVAFLRRFGDLAVLHQMPEHYAGRHHEVVLSTLCLLPFLCIILALGDPRLPRGAPRPRPGALDVVMVLDVSKSMAAEDYGQRSRLAQAREIARGLLPTLHGNRVGLVTFAGISFRQADLTADLDALDFILQYWVQVDAIRVGGSNVARAIDTGLTLFTDSSAQEKLMLVFSDGGDADDRLGATLSTASQQGVRIVTLGLGRLEPARIPLYNTEGGFQGYLQAEGHVLTTQLNEAPLQQIAAATGGTYLRLSRGDEWRPLLTQSRVVGRTLQRDEIKVFQPFLATGLVTFGIYLLLTRLYGTAAGPHGDGSSDIRVRNAPKVPESVR